MRLLALVFIGAFALRVWHIGADLPDFLEEAAPFRTALEMWGSAGASIDWNPHSLVYPSLTIYLHLVLQKLGYWLAALSGSVQSPADWWVLYKTDLTSVVLSARYVHLAFGMATIALTGLIAARLVRGAGLLAALLAALSPTLIQTSRLIYTDTVMAALALGALERMLAWHEHGGRIRWAAAVALIGLAAGAKYPGAVMLVPLAWLMWHRDGSRGLARWPLAALAAFAVFLVTTPYAVLDSGALRRDLGVHVLHLAGGHLGQSTGGALASCVRQLLRDLGPMGIALLAASVPLVWMTRLEVRARRLAVWLSLLAFLVPTVSARYVLGYYLIPIVSSAAVLIGMAAIECPRRWAAGRSWVARGLLAALLLPTLVEGVRAAATGAGFTQIEARRWLEAHLAPEELVLTEAWGPRLLSLRDYSSVQGSPLFAAARPHVQQGYAKRRWFHAVELPLKVAGRVAGRITAADGRRREIDVFPSAPDVNRVAYDPRLFALADRVVTSGAVRGRFEADPSRFADECRLYRLLDSTATLEARFVPRGSTSGPALAVYKLGPNARTALTVAGTLSPLWWAEKVPESYRRSVTGYLEVPWESGAPLRGDGTPALWVRSLATVYRECFLGFANDLATNLVDLGRCDGAQPLVEGTLMMSPHDPQAVMLYEHCTAGTAGMVSPR